MSNSKTNNAPKNGKKCRKLRKSSMLPHKWLRRRGQIQSKKRLLKRTCQKINLWKLYWKRSVKKNHHRRRLSPKRRKFSLDQLKSLIQVRCSRQKAHRRKHPQPSKMQLKQKSSNLTSFTILPKNWQILTKLVATRVNKIKQTIWCWHQLKSLQRRILLMRNNLNKRK